MNTSQLLHNLVPIGLVGILSIAFWEPGIAQSYKQKTPLDLAKERVMRGRPNLKIIGGSPAPAGAYPFQVYLITALAKRGLESDGHTCGASFIAPTWILTAGHCVTADDQVESPRNLEIYAGSLNFKNGDRIPVKSVYRHADYDDTYVENDIALLELSRTPRSGIQYKPINLIDPAKEAQQIAPGTPVNIVGWGETEKDSVSATLQHAALSIVAREECNTNILANRIRGLNDDLLKIEKKFRIPQVRMKSVQEGIVAAITGNAGALVTDSMICAGVRVPDPTVKQVPDTCQGDSGGPLVGKAADGTQVQVGIVSWGDGCGIPSVHGIYTRLAIFVDWVKQTARK